MERFFITNVNAEEIDFVITVGENERKNKVFYLRYPDNDLFTISGRNKTLLTVEDTGNEYKINFHTDTTLKYKKKSNKMEIQYHDSEYLKVMFDFINNYGIEEKIKIKHVITKV